MTNEVADISTSTHGTPTMSEALQQWMAQHVSPRGDTLKSLSDKESSDEKIAQLRTFYDQFEQAGLVAAIGRGFCLLRMRVLSEEDFATFLGERGLARSVAYRDMDLCRLFESLGSLERMERAGALSAANIRELKPALQLDGIKQLVVEGSFDGLSLDDAISMTAREIIDWRLERGRQMAARDLAHRGGVSTAPVTPPAAPPTATILREEAHAALWLGRAEVALLADDYARMQSKCGEDDADFVRGAAARAAESLRDLIQDVQALHDRIVAEQGRAILAPELLAAPGDAALDAQRGAMIEAVREAKTDRMSARHKRYGWRGAPYKPGALTLADESGQDA